MTMPGEHVAAAPLRDCNNCGNRCMDMDMDPYCAAVNKPWGRVLTRGRPEACGPDGLLWEEDTRTRPSPPPAAPTTKSLPEEEDEDRAVYMVHCNSAGCVFVKTYDFYKSQGGFTQPWGKNWQAVVATGIEDAREKGCSMFPDAKPYSQQAG